MATIPWKTQEQIDAEANATKPPTAEERLASTEAAILVLMEVTG